MSRPLHLVWIFIALVMAFQEPASEAVSTESYPNYTIEVFADISESGEDAFPHSSPSSFPSAWRNRHQHPAISPEPWFDTPAAYFAQAPPTV